MFTNVSEAFVTADDAKHTSKTLQIQSYVFIYTKAPQVQLYKEREKYKLEYRGGDWLGHTQNFPSV